MARSVPEFSPDISLIEEFGVKELFNITVHVVTPLFGGSDTAGHVDVARPVNAKDIRGLLRFWWRACKGAAYHTIADLKKAEDAIWGSTDTPSKVDVKVIIVSQGQQEQWAIYEKKQNGGYKSIPTPRPGYPPYALFPFQGKADETEPATCLKGVKFNVIITCSQNSADKIKDDVKAAIWAWLAFGGIGARTRRGCGSLWCQNNADFQNASIEILKQKSEIYITPVADNQPVNISLLSKSKIVMGTTPVDSSQAWMTVIAILKKFRQDAPYARNSGQEQNRPGRSRWPEPDSLRELARRHSAQHAPQHPAVVPGLAQNPHPFFPRADLGLPIIIKFKDDTSGDPQQCSIEGKPGTSRMASPMIMKPLAISADKSVPLIVKLNAPHAFDIDVLIKSGNHVIHTLRASTDKRFIYDTSLSRHVPPLKSDENLPYNTAQLALLRLGKNDIPGSREVDL